MSNARPRPTMKRRYELIPQMRAYEKMRVVWVPHLMNLYQPNYRSAVCNTDENGFRYTYKNASHLSYPISKENQDQRVFYAVVPLPLASVLPRIVAP